MDFEVMSFRNTFVTDFIYSATDDNYVGAAQKLNKIFKEGNDHLVSELDERGYGYFAGTNRTHGGSISELEGYVREFIGKAEEATLVPFRLTYMLESNAVITYSVEPRGSGESVPTHTSVPPKEDKGQKK